MSIKIQVKFFSVDEKLPEIPKGEHILPLLMVDFDSIYDEICPGKGHSVHLGRFGHIKNEDGTFISKWFNHYKEDTAFLVRYGNITEPRSVEFGPPCDPIVYWAYLPEIKDIIK